MHAGIYLAYMKRTEQFVIRITKDLRTEIEKRAKDLSITPTELTRKWMEMMASVDKKTLRLTIEKARKVQREIDMHVGIIAQFEAASENLEAVLDMRKERVEATADSAG